MNRRRWLLLVALLLTRSALGPAAAPPQQVADAVPRLADLAKLAKDAPAPLAKLFQELSRPADEIVLAEGTPLLVQPIPRLVGKKPNFSGELELVSLDPGQERRHVKSGDVASVAAYEERALAKIRAWREATAKQIDPEPMFEAVDTALRAVLRFHLETRLRPAVGDNPWADLQRRVERELRDTRLQHLAYRIDHADSQAAPELAERLLRLYPEDPAIGEQVRRLWTRAAEQSLKEGQLAEARRYLTRLDETYVFSPEADRLRQALQERAASLMKEAEALPEEAGVAKLKEALVLWPRLPGLRDALLKRQKAYTVLYVGVRELPEQLSPATASTDAEKQAIDLLFEGLVQPLHDKGGERFTPGVAARLPVPSPSTPAGGSWQRQFTLRRDAYWSDGARVTSGDVRHTILLLGSPKLAGRQPAWSRLVELPRLEQSSFDLGLRLHENVLEPFSLLDFKVLPRRFRGKPLERADDPEFAKMPVGSGPYAYAGRRAQNGRNYAVFAANPQFERGPAVRPAIREIRMFAWKTPGELRGLTHPVHLLLRIRTEELAELRELGFRDVRSQPARRVAFLAVNHRVPALANENLRRFLAHAIDRDALLAEHFRGGPSLLQRLGPIGSAVAVAAQKTKSQQTEFHVPLNGPYPAKSWAACPPPRVAATLHDAELARSLARQVEKQIGGVQLTLRVPAEDPRVVQACRNLADEVSHLAREAGAVVQLKVEALASRQLKEAIDRRAYQLAYVQHEFADETYWLWPLFDPSADAVAAGGSNMLGYDNDAKLASLFRAALGQRHFPTLVELTHSIHAHLVERMPLIPLWQLHEHVVVDPRLQSSPLDPLRVFAQVADWTLEAD